jgi:hypothetical protein
MKNVFILSLLFFLALPFVGWAQENSTNAIDKYFRQYVDDERFTVVYISPKLFELLDKLEIEEMDMEDEEAKAFMEVTSDLRGLRILTTDENGQELYREAKAKINTSEYEVLMTVRDKKEQNVDFLVKEDGDIITELLLLVGGEDDDFALISFVGKIDLDKVVNLAKTIEE